MKQVVLGPTFALRARTGVDETASWFAAAVDAAADRYRARRSGRHFLVTVGPSDRHFWSPWLSLEFADSQDGPARTAVEGRFNPSPAIWTGMMLAALACLTIALGGVVWAIAAWMLDRPPVGLWMSAGGLVCIAGLYLMSLMGQRLASAQMHEMEAWVRGTIDQSAGGVGSAGG